MALTKLTTVLNKISTLANIITGQATTVKTAFDHDSNVLKDYINDTLIPEIDTALTQKTTDLDTHKTSNDHDGRYYTEAEINDLLLAKTNLTGNHEGTWQGYSPAETDPGIQAVVNGHTTQISELDTKVQNIHKRKYLFIGDSYGDGQGADGPIVGWIEKVVGYLGLTVDDYYSMPRGGHGFYSTGDSAVKFLTDVQATESLMGDLTSYTDIVVCAGFNDSQATIANVDTAISQFCAYVKTKFTNAKIWIGEIGWSYLPAYTQQLVGTISAYQGCGKYGATYMTNIEYSLHDYRMFQSDNYHPNADGQISVAKNLVNCLMNGSCDVIFPSGNVALTLGAGMTAPTSLLYMHLNNGSVNIFPTTWNITFTTPITVLTKELGTIAKLYLMGLSGFTSIPVQLYLYGTIGAVAVYAGAGHITINGGVVTLQIDYPVIGGTIITDATFTQATILIPSYVLPSLYS